MKVTRGHVDAFVRGASWPPPPWRPHEDVTSGIAAVLADIPDVVPFAFAGYEDNPVFLHPCGTVTDAKEGTDLWDQVQAGECDCENTSPWMRIYVERPA